MVLGIKHKKNELNNNFLKRFHNMFFSQNHGFWVSFSAAAYTQHDIVGSDPPPATRGHVGVIVLVFFCIFRASGEAILGILKYLS